MLRYGHLLQGVPKFPVPALKHYRAIPDSVIHEHISRNASQGKVVVERPPERADVGLGLNTVYVQFSQPGHARKGYRGPVAGLYCPPDGTEGEPLAGVKDPDLATHHHSRTHHVQNLSEGLSGVGKCPAVTRCNYREGANRARAVPRRERGGVLGYRVVEHLHGDRAPCAERAFKSEGDGDSHLDSVLPRSDFPECRRKPNSTTRDWAVRDIGRSALEPAPGMSLPANPRPPSNPSNRSRGSPDLDEAGDKGSGGQVPRPPHPQAHPSAPREGVGSDVRCVRGERGKRHGRLKRPAGRYRGDANLRAARIERPHVQDKALRDRNKHRAGHVARIPSRDGGEVG